jgi:tetratricopeptide (TPR) repeat protein
MGVARARVNFLSRFSMVFGILASLSGTSAAQVRSRPSTPDIPKTLPAAVVVAAFENPSGLANLEWMRVGLPVAVYDKLGTNPGLRPVGGLLGVPEEKPIGANDPDAIAGLAARSHAAWVVTGTISRTDWKLDLTMRLWKVDGEPPAAHEVASWHKVDDFGQTLPMIADGARELFKTAGTPWPKTGDAALARAATSDYYAFMLYGRGMRAMHGLGGPPDLAKAEKDLSRAVFIDPKFAEAHYALALLYGRKKLPAKARGRLTYALDLRPDYYPPMAALAQDAAAMKNRGEAIDLAARALTIRPWDVDMRLLLGAQLWEDGDVDGAYLELGRIVKIDPNHLPARRLLVLVHASKGNGAELAAELEAIVRLDPDDRAARLDLGAAYWSLGRDEDAIRVYESIVEDDPRQLQALKFLGDIYRKRGDVTVAIVWYERALKANKNDPRPYFLLGSAYIEAGEDKKAIRIFQAAQKFPKYLADAQANLGAIYLRLGDDAQAIWFTSQAAKKRPSNPRAQYNYGLALMRAKKYPEALDTLGKAAALDPKDADVRFAQGVVLLRLGRLEDAEKAFQECLKIDPKHADAQYNLELINELRRRANEGELQQPG